MDSYYYSDPNPNSSYSESKENNLLSHPFIPNQVQFLKNELTHLKFEEDEKKKAYYESRNQLQDQWNKLVNLKSHIQRFQEEIEEVKIEIISHEAERSVWSGDMDAIHEGMANYTLKSVPRVAGLRNLREKLKLKETLTNKILIAEEKLQEKRSKLAILSHSLRESTHSINSRSFSQELSLSLGAVDQSMSTRTQLLSLANEIEDLENKLVTYNNSIRSLEQDLNQSVDDVITNELNSGTGSLSSSSVLNSDRNLSFTANKRVLSSSSSFIHQPTPSQKNLSTSAAGNLAGEPTPMLEIVSYGPPLSSDLMDALMKGEYPATNATGLAAGLANNDTGLLPEFTIEEVVAGQASLFRMNGEIPQIYLQRLEKRLLSLLSLEVQVVRDFHDSLSVVRRRREIVSDLSHTPSLPLPLPLLTSLPLSLPLCLVEGRGEQAAEGRAADIQRGANQFLAISFSSALLLRHR
jgi:predicted  nucleic acid-binding Zn-ribbon protein